MRTQHSVLILKIIIELKIKFSTTWGNEQCEKI